MGFYTKSPFKPMPVLLIQGTPEYLFGTFSTQVGPTQGFIISDSAVTTTGTVTFQIVSGNIPVVDSLITVIGSANAGGNFNVTNATVLTVTTTTTGVCTVTYAITSSTVAAGTPDSGQVYIEVYANPDNLTVGIVAALPAASIPAASPVGAPTSGKSLSASVNLLASTAAHPSTLSGVTIVIQGANTDADGEYKTIGTLTAAGAAGNTYDWQSGQGQSNAAGTGALADGAVNLPNFRFYRLAITAATGAGYLTGKIME